MSVLYVDVSDQFRVLWTQSGRLSATPISVPWVGLARPTKPPAADGVYDRSTHADPNEAWTSTAETLLLAAAVMRAFVTTDAAMTTRPSGLSPSALQTSRRRQSLCDCLTASRLPLLSRFCWLLTTRADEVVSRLSHSFVTVPFVCVWVSQ